MARDREGDCCDKHTLRALVMGRWERSMTWNLGVSGRKIMMIRFCILVIDTTFAEGRCYFGGLWMYDWEMAYLHPFSSEEGLGRIFLEIKNSLFDDLMILWDLGKGGRTGMAMWSHVQGIAQ